MKTILRSFLQNTAPMASLILILLALNTSFAQNGPGWYFTSYKFEDGTRQGESVLAGTTSKMKDVVSFTGAKGNLIISHKRTDVKTGTLLAAVKYNVIWSEPAAVLVADQKASINFTLKTLSSLGWKPDQQTIFFNQGGMGVYFATAEGTKYITKDMNGKLTTEKTILKGTPGTKKYIQMNFGKGFRATYNYDWRDK